MAEGNEPRPLNAEYKTQFSAVDGRVQIQRGKCEIIENAVIVEVTFRVLKQITATTTPLFGNFPYSQDVNHIMSLYNAQLQLITDAVPRVYGGQMISGKQMAVDDVYTVKGVYVI